MNEDWFTKEQLHFAAQDGDLAKVKTLVDCGYDVNAFDEDLFFTPLHYAAMGEHIEVMKYLISVGADVNAHNPDFAAETPLGQVAQNCSFEVAKTLIEAGADPTIPGWMQISALYRASKREKTEGLRVYELLLSAAKERSQQQP
jgi:ankyrin repeat protein